MKATDSEDNSGISGQATAPACFGRFAWPVPLSFASAVAAARFEQGDVLYRDPRAFSVLEDAGLDGLQAIQVLAPKRSARGASMDGEGDRRSSSWTSPVTIQLIELGRGEASEAREITQGQLMMALWQGDAGWLESGREAPPMPRGARELLGSLDQSRAAFDDAASRPAGRKRRRAPERGSRFVFVVDLSSDASRAKARAVEQALRATGDVDRIDRTPEAAGIEAGAEFHPALIVRCLVLPGRRVEEVLPVLRSCLYSGRATGAGLGRSDSEPLLATRSTDPDRDVEQIDVEEEGGASKNRFSIARHGLLEDVAG